jgi:hypothetical protein
MNIYCITKVFPINFNPSHASSHRNYSFLPVQHRNRDFSSTTKRILEFKVYLVRGRGEEHRSFILLRDKQSKRDNGTARKNNRSFNNDTRNVVSTIGRSRSSPARSSLQHTGCHVFQQQTVSHRRSTCGQGRCHHRRRGSKIR